MKRLAVLGAGNMGGAMVKGLLASRVVSADNLCVYDIEPQRARALKPLGPIRLGASVRDALRGADVALVCVKPQGMEPALAEMRGSLRKGAVVVSVAAGITTSSIEKALGSVPVIRVMPNTPALYGAGAMVYCLGRHARGRHDQLARRLLGALGKVWKVPENLMDAVTALSGSGPAYVFLLTEAMAAAGTALGMPPDVANDLARQTVYGAGTMLARSPEPAGDLRRRVTSPGGTTAAALETLEAAHFSKIVNKALTAARNRSRALSKPDKERKP